jgi:hypothetical protein
MATHEEKLQDIKEHPEKHHHTFEALQACCIVDGALSLALLDAHGKYAALGFNGGQRCDVVSGPCACGAWH